MMLRTSGRLVASPSLEACKNRPKHYMDKHGSPNVLWELAPIAADDTGFHRGADVAMLSQFPKEKEVLFPPCTMLEVRRKGAEQNQCVEPGDAPAATACASVGAAPVARGVPEGLMAEDEVVGKKTFTKISVLPYFL